MHQKENIGLVELATISFGQSFQITPVQLAATVSSIINGGVRITPHLGVMVKERDGALLEVLQQEEKGRIVSEQTSETMRYILEQVVDGGSGKKRVYRGLPNRRENRYLRDTPKERQQIYLLFYRLCAGRGSTGSCAVHH